MSVNVAAVKPGEESAEAGGRHDPAPFETPVITLEGEEPLGRVHAEGGSGLDVNKKILNETVFAGDVLGGEIIDGKVIEPKKRPFISSMFPPRRKQPAGLKVVSGEDQPPASTSNPSAPLTEPSASDPKPSAPHAQRSMPRAGRAGAMWSPLVEHDALAAGQPLNDGAGLDTPVSSDGEVLLPGAAAAQTKKTFLAGVSPKAFFLFVPLGVVAVIGGSLYWQSALQKHPMAAAPQSAASIASGAGAGVLIAPSASLATVRPRERVDPPPREVPAPLNEAAQLTEIFGGPDGSAASHEKPGELQKSNVKQGVLSPGASSSGAAGTQGQAQGQGAAADLDLRGVQQQVIGLSGSENGLPAQAASLDPQSDAARPLEQAGTGPNNVRVASLPGAPPLEPGVVLQQPAASEPQITQGVAPQIQPVRPPATQHPAAQSADKKRADADNDVLSRVMEFGAQVLALKTQLTQVLADNKELRKTAEDKIADFERRLDLQQVDKTIAKINAIDVNAPPAAPASAASGSRPVTGVPKSVRLASLKPSPAPVPAKAEGEPRKTYRIQAASPGLAMLADASNTGDDTPLISVSAGHEVAGYGKVLKIVQEGSSWKVVTEHGTIE